MPRISFLLCSGVCLLNATVIIGQSLTKNPAQQQVIGYRLQEQKMWNVQQLPKNSVLFKSDHRYAAWQSGEFSFKKDRACNHFAFTRQVVFDTESGYNECDFFPIVAIIASVEPVSG